MRPGRRRLSFGLLALLGAALAVLVTAAANGEQRTAEPIVLIDAPADQAANPPAVPPLEAPPVMPDAADIADLIGVPVAAGASHDVALAVAVSRRLFPTGGARDVVLTRDAPMGDAHAAGALVGLLDTTLLLTDPEVLTPITADEIARLGQPNVHILGGEAAVSAAIERQLSAAGHVVHRHAGPTQADTAAHIAALHFPAATTAVLVQLAPPDGAGVALAASALAAARRVPLLVTDGEALSPATREYLSRAGTRQVVAVAGSGDGISAGVGDALDALGIGWFQWGGGDEPATAVAIARNRGFLELADADSAVIVDARQPAGWVDAFLRAVVMLRPGDDDAGGPVLLADGPEIPQVTADYLGTAGGVVEITCSTSVAAAVCGAARDLADAS